MSSTDRRERLAAAGQWLREERQRRGIATVSQLARELGIDKSLVSNYERGINEVSADRAAQIAELFGMDLIEVRRGLGLWVPAPGDQKGSEDDLPSPEDYEGIVVPMPDGSGNTYYAIRKEELAKMTSEQRQRLAREMIDYMMEIERQQPPEADDA